MADSPKRSKRFEHSLPQNQFLIPTMFLETALLVRNCLVRNCLRATNKSMEIDVKKKSLFQTHAAQTHEIVWPSRGFVEIPVMLGCVRHQ